VICTSRCEDAPQAFGETRDEIARRASEDWGAVVAAWTAGTTSVAFVAEDADGPCGFVRGDATDPRAPPGTALVSNLWTAPRQRRRGLGRGLMDAVTRWATLRKAKRISLGVTDANQAVIGFYEALGYRVTGRRAPAGSNSALQVVVMAHELHS
jgi:ribosomal protein S18 acetylase RimI-like enzyme